MKLFLISNMFPDSLSPGYGIFVKNVVDELPSHGIEISQKAVIYGKSHNKFGKIYKYMILYFAIIAKYFRNYDAIYVHYPNHVAPLLLALRLFQKKRLFVNFHGSDLLYKNSGISYLLGQSGEKLTSYSSLVIVPSEYFKEIIHNRRLCKLERIIVSPSGGVNLNIFYHNNKIDDSFSLHLGYVGRLELDKGIIELLDSIAQLVMYVNLKATIIGYGPAESIVNEYIQNQNLGDHIIVRSGVAQDELCQFYNEFDLFVFPTKYQESLGLVGIEAMACGVPVIGSNIGGIPSYLKDGYNGFLVTPGNADAITHAVLKYVKMSLQEKDVMIKNAINTGKRYSRTLVVGQLANYMKQALL